MGDERVVFFVRFYSELSPRKCTSVKIDLKFEGGLMCSTVCILTDRLYVSLLMCI